MALTQDIRDSLTLPAFCAPMFLCSSVDLAIECRKAGIAGSLTANHCRDLAELPVLTSARSVLHRLIRVSSRASSSALPAWLSR
jgi:nitronate monooxygenase